MRSMQLSDYFVGFGIKRLSSHEVDPSVSRGHEFQGSSALRQILGAVKRQFNSDVVVLSDSSPGLQRFSTDLTWYNARSKQSKRSPEWRLYYPHSAAFIQHVLPGDLVIVALGLGGKLHLFFARQGSNWERKLIWLFQKPPQGGAVTFSIGSPEVPVGFSAETVMVQLMGSAAGSIAPVTAQHDLSSVISCFGGSLPSSEALSRFARKSYPGAKEQEIAVNSPDLAITEWMSWERQLFFAFQKQITASSLKKLLEDYGRTQDDTNLAKFYQSQQQRRFSRAGNALENHVEAVLKANAVLYTRHGKTENKKEPDFLFPGVDRYRDKTFPKTDLRMLGCKTSCRDRWRQVLSEAALIEEKHLMTLEPGISKDQTDEMAADGVILVVPKPLFETFSDVQQKHLVSFREFIADVLEIQRRHSA